MEPTKHQYDHDTATVHSLINGITPQGTTDLSAGYLLGLSEARRSSQPRVPPRSQTMRAHPGTCAHRNHRPPA